MLYLRYSIYILSWGRFIIHPIQTDVRLFTCLLHNITMIWMMREGGKKGSFSLHILKICRHRRLKRIGAATTTIRKKIRKQIEL